MTDALLGATIQVLLEKVLSAATDRIGLVIGFKEDLASLRDSLDMVRAVLVDAEERQRQDQAVKLWLKRLEGVAYDADDVLDELNYELLRRKVESKNQPKRKVCCFFSFNNTIAFRWRMASKVRDINTRLKKINQEANNFGLSRQVGGGANYAPLPADAARVPINRETDSIARQNVVGRANDKSKILETLLSSSPKIVSVLSITGMGGMGKSTLAQLVYNDQQIISQFEKRAWVSVSENFEVTRLFKQILESLTQGKVDIASRDTIVQGIRKQIGGKKYLLVLDDVWNENPILWAEFFHSLEGINSTSGNWILVTTRSRKVASIVGANIPPYELRKLSDDDCWSLLKDKVVPGGEVVEELEAIREKVLRKCEGLPLAASVLGGLLRIKRKEEWHNILEIGFSQLSEDENRTMQLHKLSFDHLPTASIKKCFQFCSVLGKDFFFYQENLIQMWMAEGFLQPNLANEVMEDIGRKNMDILLESSLLQETKEDDPFFDEEVRLANMHDLVHDFALFISQSDGLGDRNSQPRRLFLNFSGAEEQGNLKDNSSMLRALFVAGREISNDMLSNLKHLRVLALSMVPNEELPTSVCKLIHLKYLEISFSRIKVLPEFICQLYHLQTLVLHRLVGTKEIELPKGLKNLINLRHLHFFARSAYQMPKDIGWLTCLQTLEFFNVGREKGCQIDELRYLKNLRGRMVIRNLELVNGKEKVQEAGLINKEKLNKLTFKWSKSREADNKDENVLEGLEPHPNLQKLSIKNYMGCQFPAWLMNMAICVDHTKRLSRKLNNLVSLVLANCKRCEEVPVLGQLPSLESLELRGLENLRCLGRSFYGMENTSGSTSNKSGGQVLRKLFPALKFLKLSNMPNLKEWMEAEAVAGEQAIQVFPSLEDLVVEDCSKLSMAPSHFPSLKSLSVMDINQVLPARKICSNATALKNLWIKGIEELNAIGDVLYHQNLEFLVVEDCPNLSNLSGCGTSLKQMKIQSCNNLKELPEDLYMLLSLQSLCISGCPNLKSIPIPSGQKGLKSLQDLEISYCDGLTSLPTDILESRTSLLNLEVYGCPNLSSFSVDLQQTPALISLSLFECPKLNTMPKGLDRLDNLRFLKIGPFSDQKEESELFLVFSSSSILGLSLIGRPNSDSLPDQLQYLTGITKLHLEKFGVEILPDLLGNLQSLEQFHLYDCEKLRYFPSMAAMRCLTKLRTLEISGCPLLQQSCINRSDPSSEWSKISHIPSISIEDQFL